MDDLEDSNNTSDEPRSTDAQKLTGSQHASKIDEIALGKCRGHFRRSPFATQKEKFLAYRSRDLYERTLSSSTTAAYFFIALLWKQA